MEHGAGSSVLEAFLDGDVRTRPSSMVLAVLGGWWCWLLSCS